MLASFMLFEIALQQRGSCLRSKSWRGGARGLHCQSARYFRPPGGGWDGPQFWLQSPRLPRCPFNHDPCTSPYLHASRQMQKCLFTGSTTANAVGVHHWPMRNTACLPLSSLLPALAWCRLLLSLNLLQHAGQGSLVALPMCQSDGNMQWHTHHKPCTMQVRRSIWRAGSATMPLCTAHPSAPVRGPPNCSTCGTLTQCLGTPCFQQLQLRAASRMLL